jgi:hypothetical protein
VFLPQGKVRAILKSGEVGIGDTKVVAKENAEKAAEEAFWDRQW